MISDSLVEFMEFGVDLDLLLPDGHSVDDYFSDEYLAQRFNNIPFDVGCETVSFSSGFGENCVLLLSDKVLDRLKNGNSHLQIRRMGGTQIVSNVFIALGDYSGNITVLVGSSGMTVVGNCGQLNMDLRVGHDSRIIVGDKTTSNGTRIVAINSTIAIGRDVMFSDEVLIQGFDQHGLVDLSSMKIINANRKETIIEKHVWVGRRATLMPGVTLGGGQLLVLVLLSHLKYLSVLWLSGCLHVSLRKISRGVDRGPILTLTRMSILIL